MRIISLKPIKEFWEHHPPAKKPLQTWSRVAHLAEWRSLVDVRADYATADLVGDRLIFDIGGNKYRLIVGVSWKHQILFVKFVGTHAEYDKMDVEAVDADRS